MVVWSGVVRTFGPLEVIMTQSGAVKAVAGVLSMVVLPALARGMR